jgi:hypothetical protein
MLLQVTVGAVVAKGDRHTHPGRLLQANVTPQGLGYDQEGPLHLRDVAARHRGTSDRHTCPGGFATSQRGTPGAWYDTITETGPSGDKRDAPGDLSARTVMKPTIMKPKLL